MVGFALCRPVRSVRLIFPRGKQHAILGRQFDFPDSIYDFPILSYEGCKMFISPDLSCLANAGQVAPELVFPRRAKCDNALSLKSRNFARQNDVASKVLCNTKQLPANFDFLKRGQSHNRHVSRNSHFFISFSDESAKQRTLLSFSQLKCSNQRTRSFSQLKSSKRETEKVI